MCVCSYLSILDFPVGSLTSTEDRNVVLYIEVREIKGALLCGIRLFLLWALLAYATLLLCARASCLFMFIPRRLGLCNSRGVDPDKHSACYSSSPLSNYLLEQSTTHARV